MSDLPPPDRPTERHAPAQPVDPVRRRVPADPAASGVPVGAPLDAPTLGDELRRVRTLLSIVGTIAAIALVVGLYAAIVARDDDNQGASNARVERLEDRVSRLVTLVKDTREDTQSGTDTTDLQSLNDRIDDAAKASDVSALSTQVEKLAAQTGAGDGDGDVQAAIDELSGRIDELGQKVTALEQSGGGTTP